MIQPSPAGPPWTICIHCSRENEAATKAEIDAICLQLNEKGLPVLKTDVRLYLNVPGTTGTGNTVTYDDIWMGCIQYLSYDQNGGDIPNPY